METENPIAEFLTLIEKQHDLLKLAHFRDHVATYLVQGNGKAIDDDWPDWRCEYVNRSTVGPHRRCEYRWRGRIWTLRDHRAVENGPGTVVSRQWVDDEENGNERLATTLIPNLMYERREHLVATAMIRCGAYRKLANAAIRYVGQTTAIGGAVPLIQAVRDNHEELLHGVAHNGQIRREASHKFSEACLGLQDYALAFGEPANSHSPQGKPFGTKPVATVRVPAADREVLIVAHLYAHHKVNEQDMKNPTPVSVNGTAETLGISAGALSKWFKDQFGSHNEYQWACQRNPNSVAAKLRSLHGDNTLSREHFSGVTLDDAEGIDSRLDSDGSSSYASYGGDGED